MVAWGGCSQEGQAGGGTGCQEIARTETEKVGEFVSLLSIVFYENIKNAYLYKVFF